MLPRTFVRVGREAATGELSLEALVARLEAGDWTLVTGADSASTCDVAQALPCRFSRQDAEDVLSVVVLSGGGYELTASEVDGPPSAS